MTQNPVEANPVTRFLLGLAVIFAMMVGGGVVGRALEATTLPYGLQIGVFSGALLVFAGFAALYRRFNASSSADGDGR